MAAVRFVFGFRGDGLWLVQRRAVETVAPLSVPLADLADRSGFWCEVRDAAGRAVHRQVLRDPRHPTDEVPGRLGPEPPVPGRLRHVPHDEPSGVFTVLTPADVEGGTVALVQRRSGDRGPRDVLAVPLGAAT